ncbi:hypothetical protein HCX50_03920 [Microbacterium oxydans]|uniref:hypothetical protein n=1 Tax=Microbacterium sp. B19(2022) TaxID=2914045 RepID=UPI0014304574|nr:hypothetical protein [Microbacterium sp. B19(2022)]NJI58573.1 hypothetical protein [Microbacterium sp. B19(2022)]
MKVRPGQADLTLHIRSTDLCRTPPKNPGADQFIAHLGSTGLGSVSYIVGRRDPETPEWIVLDYADDAHERVWRRARTHADGVLSYALVEDDSSSGYLTVA